MNIRDKNRIKAFFNDGGYVFDFNNSTFDSFTTQSIGIAIQSEYGLSKGKSLSKFIDEGKPFQIVKLTKDLLDYYEDLPKETIWRTEQKDSQLKVIRDSIEEYVNSSDIYLQEEAINLTKKFDSLYIEKQVGLMTELINTHPADSIGKAKELLESCFKHILDKEKIDYSSSVTLQELRKKVFKLLNLDANENISAQSNQEVKKILSSFVQIIEGISHLRNEKGDGHGKGSDFIELPSRYARLVVNSAVSIVLFIWETYEMK
ncbi:abortive infection family protein [Enterococcus faecalis]|uniref:abortive infection family protein n=1 Tax=Enterococcus faecalis TaxID=1351 RepID=UPI003DA2A8C9